MKPLFIFLAILWGGICTTFSASPLSEEEALQIESKIENHQKSVKTVRALFTQSVIPPHQKNPILSQGRLLYRRPQTLRIDYDQPTGDGMILTPQETLSWKKGLLTQVTPHDPQKPSFRRVLLEVLEKTPRDWQKEYHRTMTQTDSCYEVLLTPLQAETTLPQNIVAKLRLTDLQLTEIEVRFAQFTWKIHLHSIELNRSLKIRLQR